VKKEGKRQLKSSELQYTLVLLEFSEEGLHNNEGGSKRGKQKGTEWERKDVEGLTKRKREKIQDYRLKKASLFKTTRRKKRRRGPERKGQGNGGKL